MLPFIPLTAVIFATNSLNFAWYCNAWLLIWVSKQLAPNGSDSCSNFSSTSSQLWYLWLFLMLNVSWSGLVISNYLILKWKPQVAKMFAFIVEMFYLQMLAFLSHFWHDDRIFTLWYSTSISFLVHWQIWLTHLLLT